MNVAEEEMAEHGAVEFGHVLAMGKLQPLPHHVLDGGFGCHADMDRLPPLVLDNDGAAAEQGLFGQIAWVDGIGHNRVIDRTDVFERFGARLVLRQVQVQVGELHERGVVFMRLGCMRDVLRVFERDFDLPPCAVNTFHLIAVNHFVQNEGADVGAKRNGGKPFPECGHAAFAPEYLLRLDGELPRHGEEELAVLEMDARPKRRLIGQALLCPRLMGRVAIG